MTRLLAVALTFLALQLCCVALGGNIAEPPATLPRGIPEPLWHSRIGTHVITEKRAALGEDLFHDPILSADGTMSCATCHDAAIGYADHNPLAIGARRQMGTRNVPTLFNSLFSDFLFRDGRARSFEEQALQPLRNSREMGPQTDGAILSRLNQMARYRKRFSVLYGEDSITMESLLDAMATFEFTLVSGDSEFDRFLAHQSAGFSASAERGWDLFRGPARCIRCHSFEPDSPFFTDFAFHNTGIAARHGGFRALMRIARNTRTSADLAKVAADDATAELGRFRITGDHADIGAFRTPSLRDVALTAPYMHDGSLSTLAAVVAWYNDGGAQVAHIPPLHLDPNSQKDLVAFLETLTGSSAQEKALGDRR